jgi:hypothetical protein
MSFDVCPRVELINGERRRMVSGALYRVVLGLADVLMYFADLLK